MNITRIADATIPAPDYKDVLYNKHYITDDIVQRVLWAYNHDKDSVAAFASHLKGATVYDTCRNVWHFIHDNIRYKVDPKGDQWVKSPARLWSTKLGDCKSFSLMAACILNAVGIRPTFRFVSYTDKKIPTHVYIVVKDGWREIIVDAVINSFDYQKPYQHKFDFDMSGLYYLSGVDNPYIGKKSKAEKKQARAVKKEERKASGKKTFFGKIVKAVTTPVRLVAKGALELKLPEAAPTFLYLFITKPEILAQMPAVVQDKRKKQMGLADFIVKHIGMKRDHLMGILRKGIVKAYGMQPEEFLSQQMGMQISGIGFLPAVAFIKPLLAVVQKLGMKIADPAKIAPDIDNDFASMNNNTQRAVANDIEDDLRVKEETLQVPTVEQNQATGEGEFAQNLQRPAAFVEPE